jgi:hypothetical protein
MPRLVALQRALALLQRAELFLAIGRAPSLDDLDKAVELHPKLADAFAVRAIVRARLGRDGAREDADRAISLGASTRYQPSLEQILRGR